VKRDFSAIFLCILCESMLLAQPAPIHNVVDAASFGTQLAPGSLANVVGGGFGTSTVIPVTVGGKPCAVLKASASQLLVQIAVNAPLGPAAIQVGNSAPFSISLQQYAPALYSADGFGQGNVEANAGGFGPPRLPFQSALVG